MWGNMWGWKLTGSSEKAARFINRGAISPATCPSRLKMLHCQALFDHCEH